MGSIRAGRRHQRRQHLDTLDNRTADSVRAKVALVLVGLGWVLPFLSPNFREPISSFYGEATAFLLGLAAVTVLAGPMTWPQLRLPRASLVFLGFAGLILVHAMLGRSIYLQANLVAILYLLWATAMAALAWRLKEIFGLDTLVTALSWFALAGVLVSAAIGMIQFWGTPAWLKPFVLLQMNGRIYGNTGQPNHLADYLCLGLVSLGFLHGRGRMRLPLAIAAAAPILLILAASGSRSAWLYLAGTIVLAAAYRKMRPSPEATRILVFSAVMIAEFLLAQWLAGALAGSSAAPVDLVASRVRNQGVLSPIRNRLWYESWIMFVDAPVLGQGFHQFPWQHFLLNAQLASVPMGEVQYDNAHNIVLHTLAEFGLAGLVVLVAGVVVWIKGVSKQPVSATFWWLLSAAAILGMHSMLEYPLWYSYFLGIAAILLGASDTVAIRPAGRAGGKLVPALVLVLGWMAAANIYQDYRTLQSLHRVQSRTETANGRGTAEALLELQQYSLFTPFVELALSRMITLDSNKVEDKLIVNDAVMHFSPTPDVTYRQAALLALGGRVDDSRLQWDRAAANYPETRARIEQTLEAASAREPALAALHAYTLTRNR